jgi:glycosyltransferase involved in cell wall biosynthesis
VTARPRILAATTDLRLTGAKRVLVDGACGLDRERFESAVLLLSPTPPDDPLRRELADAGVTVHHVHVKSRLHVRGLRALGRWIEQEARPDVVHTHCARSAAVARLVLWKVPAPPRVVVHFHGTVSPRALRPKHRLLDRLLRGRTDLVLAPTAHAAERGARIHAFRGLPIRVIPNGVDLARLERPPRTREEVRRSWGVSDEARVVLLLGRWGSAKGHDVLLDAIPSILATPDEVRFVLVAPDGGGEFRGRLERRVRTTALRRHVVVTGRDTDPASCYLAADVVTMPSRDEPFGLVAVEAMAAARPLVAARVGGLPEVCGEDAGVLWVRPGDPDDLARAVLVALAEEPASRAARVATSRARAERFSLGRYLQGLEDAYAEVLGRPDLARARPASPAGTASSARSASGVPRPAPASA